jgi:hypothetical protein
MRHQTAAKDGSSVIDLAFYAGRYMDSCDWKPFFKAVYERNPVSVAYFHDRAMSDVYDELVSWPGESIYDGNRLALPDEVINFKRGDGIEKAISMANVARSRHLKVSFKQDGAHVVVLVGDDNFEFSSLKSLIIGDEN